MLQINVAVVLPFQELLIELLLLIACHFSHVIADMRQAYPLLISLFHFRFHRFNLENILLHHKFPLLLHHFLIIQHLESL